MELIQWDLKSSEFFQIYLLIVENKMFEIDEFLYWKLPDGILHKFL